MAFYPTKLDFNRALFDRQDWSYSVYEVLSYKRQLWLDGGSEAKEDGYTLRLYGDSDHTVNSISRRSGTDFVVYLQNALIC